MVIIFLNNIQFEADRFETRTMPTPNMKGKEVIYWIKVSTEDKRLASDIQKFLESAPRFIELRVPNAFISTKTEWKLSSATAKGLEADDCSEGRARDYRKRFGR